MATLPRFTDTSFGFQPENYRGKDRGGTQEKDISSEAMYCNPILFSKVTTEEETPGHRIGYLVYSGFEAGFDQELFDVFKEFKSQNITDLIWIYVTMEVATLYQPT